ncbi:MAG TPA: hypothetical protein HA254_00930 [Candidatus Diapherotrites archaeon]|uniref:Thioredoxin domain-containing protein n=1 Tax=Candidatus Iainarchaeum sp. TaxID=3101447 RepID=A0A7J4IUM1_9ARCH|nr:hypothetical protein [Candidatus Diapherotrites archaeon]
MASTTQKAKPDTVSGAISEGKEKFLDSNPAPKHEGAKPPYVLLGMLLIVGILAGAAIAITLIKPPVQPNGNDTNAVNDVQYRTVPITMLYSDACKSCRETNTIEELFKVRQIPYTLKKVEASSQEGKALISKYRIDTAPMAIIDAQKMEFYPTTKSSFDDKANLIKKLSGAYIAPELNLNDNYYYPVYFLEKVAGFCSTDKPTVVQFDDYYQPEFTSKRALLHEFIRDFNQSTDIRFSYAQTNASWDANSSRGNLFLSCASQQGKYIELERAMAGIYCNNPFKGDETILTTPEVFGCSTLSNHFGIPLTPIELDRAANRAGLDANALVTCIDTNRVILNNAMKTVQELNITRPGTFLIDCRETAGIDYLKDSFCSMHPENAACSNRNDTNPGQ